MRKVHNNIYACKDSLLYYSKEIVLLIDLDGTLVDTNYANFLAYNYALKQVLGSQLSFDKSRRFTREVLKETYPTIPSIDLEKIIKIKNEKYSDHLDKTRVNSALVMLLQKYHKTNNTVLVTKSHKRRAEETLSYHNLMGYFSNKIFAQANNKYEEAINTLSLSISLVAIFEDDDLEIGNAVKIGIPKQNINKIKF